MNMMAANLLMLLPMITMVCATDCDPSLGKQTCKKRKTCRWASDKFQLYQGNADMPWVYGACFGPTDCVQGRFGKAADHCATATTKQDCNKKGPPKYNAGLAKGWKKKDWNTNKGNFKKWCRWSKKNSDCTAKRKSRKLDGEPCGATSTCSGYQLNDTTFPSAISEWLSDESTAFTTYENISCWDISEVTDMQDTFKDEQTFNADLSKWDTSKVTTMLSTFSGAAAFTADLSKWDTSNVTNLKNTFYNAAAFNGNLSTWATSKVTHMGATFGGVATFNADISKWDTSKVTHMGATFGNAAVFNGDLSKWNTSKVEYMKEMFYKSVAFNGDLSTWDTSKVTTMQSTFNGAAAFNGDLSKWDTSKVTSKESMFSGATNFACNSNLPSGLTTTETSCNN